MATIFQKAGLWVNDETAAPVELMAPLAAVGYARVDIMLNARPDHLPENPPPSYTEKMRGLGFATWGNVWADSFHDPMACLDFCKQQQERLRLSGFVINAEDGIEALDQLGEGWSKKFCEGYRQWTKRALCLNTYIGCGGIAMPYWERADARMFCQTHHEGNTLEWGMPGYVEWARRYGWAHPVKVKACLASYKGSDGQLPDIQAQVQSMKQAWTIGYVAYYAEGSFSDETHLKRLLDYAVSAGVAYRR